MATSTATTTYAYDHEGNRTRYTADGLTTVYPSKHFDVSRATTTKKVYLGKMVADPNSNSSNSPDPNSNSTTNRTRLCYDFVCTQKNIIYSYNPMYLKTIIATLAVLILGAGAYVTWYSYDREVKKAQVERCNYGLEHPKPPVMTTAPDGSLTPVYSIDPCTTVVIPPSLWDLIRGNISFEGIPERMKVNPYSLLDVLLGNYTLGDDMSLLCDQSATTTDCSTLPSPTSELQPYMPPDVAEPSEQWVSATNTPIVFSGFSFVLPPGWHGSVYEKEYAGGLHALAQKTPDTPGFVIDCPPEGGGYETATRLSSEERSFVTAGTSYSIAIEKWTAPDNEPWYLVWIRAHEPGNFSTDASGTVCLAQGSATADVVNAMQALYQTLQ